LYIMAAMLRTFAFVCVAAAGSCLGQVTTGPAVCFSINDGPTSNGTYLPLAAGGHTFVGFTAPQSATIERIDVAFSVLAATQATLDVFQTVGGMLGPQIGTGTLPTPPQGGLVAFNLVAPVAFSSGSVYALKLTIATGSGYLTGPLTPPMLLPYALVCGPNPPPMFFPCVSFPTLGTFGARLQFRATPCGPTPWAVATQVGVGCGPPGSGTVTLASIPPVLGTAFWFGFSSAGGGTVQVFLASGPATAGVNPGLAPGCLVYLDFGSLQSQPFVTFGTGGGLAASSTLGIPNDPALAGFTVTTQAAFSASGPFPAPGTFMLSNALQLTLGY
jgi:hypothetical protein